MTGYGKTICELENKKVICEVKSLNSKQLDLNMRFPGIYREKELSVRNIISKKLIRGKVDLSLFIENIGAISRNVINKTLAINYYKQIAEINSELGISSNSEVMQSVLRFPDVLETKREEINIEDWKEINNHIIMAIDNLIEFRQQEGQILENDITNRINIISELLGQIGEFENERISKVKNKIKDGLKELAGQQEINENRLEQELIYYIEKLDITEEKVRLANHCKYFIETAKENGAIGKKLGFVIQEIGREINTIGSKANNTDIQRIVIKMKDELEKIKEQLLNVL